MQEYLLKLTKGEIAALEALSSELDQTPESIILYALSREHSRFACACDICILRKTCCYLSRGAFFPKSKGIYMTANRRRCNCSRFKEDTFIETNSHDTKRIPY